jgi:hypothetical protein
LGLAVEANGVVALQMMKLMRGGRRARREAELMVSEKVDIDKNQCALPFDDYCRQGIEGLEPLEMARRWTTFENRDCGEMNTDKMSGVPNFSGRTEVKI